MVFLTNLFLELYLLTGLVMLVTFAGSANIIWRTAMKSLEFWVTAAALAVLILALWPLILIIVWSESE